MKPKLALLTIMIVFASAPTLADAKRCVKGAIVGGVAGHVAGHHGLAGAAIGCAVGHHRAKVKAKAQATQGKTPPGNRAASPNAPRSGDAVSNDGKAPPR